MTAAKLKQLTGTQLLDVRLAEDYEACHLEGAVSNCVFEVAFGDRLPQTAPDPGAPTVVYGPDGKSREAEVATEKLRRAGYTDVHVLEGGLEAAREADFPVATGAPLPSLPAIADGEHLIDVGNSRVEWTGRNLLNKHWGTAPIRSGHLFFENGLPVEGEITIDLLGIACDDLSGGDLHDVLIDHLHSDDFFDVASFPDATLRIVATEHGDHPSPGGPNLRIEAQLTLRGQTHPVDLVATAGVTPEGKAAAQASLSIDRTRWGVLYGSGKFFRRLAGHLVNDMIDFDVKIVTS